MVTIKTFDSRTEWLEGRTKTIGGSEAAAVLGVSPYMTNAELYDLKTGGTVKEISDNPLVIYGTESEEYLRELFRLDFPNLKVHYTPNNLWKNSIYPWAHASLDGWLTDSHERRGVLEIKTASIMNGIQARKWDNRIPDHYYIQVLHEMAVADAEFAIVKAQLKRVINGDLIIQTNHYTIERNDDEIGYLMEEERMFFEQMKKGKRPGVMLPAI